ncbi:hypothetical protein QBC40DRAFT_77074 [Triangularia verruculosa]|uniref:LOV domain-containing protein n=1 Tax=Triangularia verruculosa TaxID=2587418 RepID=A0AAN6XFX0_9PEZI|nr:hypothetical protein QBC40DRAFT_77074 [Triangularia verruculosa]
MLSVKRGTLDSLSTLSDSQSLRGSGILVLPSLNDPRSSVPNATALSPPPASKPPQPQQNSCVPSRLRSDSGLSLHTNQAAFRQYTDYNSDGSVRSGSSHTKAGSSTEAGSLDNVPIGPKPSIALKDTILQAKLLPNFFDPAVIKLAFSNPTTGHKLCRYAASKGGAVANQMDFLIRVDDYFRAFGNMTTLVSQITTEFTGMAASTPIELPRDVANMLRNNTKHCARTALPSLERLYREAKAAVEERLAETLYPEFVKYQLSQCMRTSLSAKQSLAGGFRSTYPGLGDAFCLTTPLEPDNPIICASDGFLRMSGYGRGEIMDKNCRFFQGISTDPAATRRISEAVSAGQQVSELLINHRRDGSPFWNLLFICPLLEGGTIRYFLGAQINVSESMGSDYKDILRILNFGSPGAQQQQQSQLQSEKGARQQEKPVWRNPINANAERPLSSNSTQQRPTPRSRFFRRFSQKGSNTQPRTPTRPSTPRADSLPQTGSATAKKAMLPTILRRKSEALPEEYSTPYSRYFVLKYTPSLFSTATATSASTVQSTRSNYQLGSSANSGIAAQLTISFSSPFALAMLGLNEPNDAKLVSGRDIFAVLTPNAGTINSSSNKQVRSTVYSAIAAGESVSLNMTTTIFSPPTQQPTSPAKKGHTRGNSAIKAGDYQPSRLSDTLDRGADFLSSVFSHNGAGSGSKNNTRKVVSHWTPLKNGDGEVEFVVVVLTAAS